MHRGQLVLSIQCIQLIRPSAAFPDNHANIYTFPHIFHHLYKMAFVWERARETIFYTHSYCFRSNINHWLARAHFWGSSFVRVYERIAIVCGGAINFDKYYLLNAITQIHSIQTHNPTGADHKRLYWALHEIAASRRRRDMMVGMFALQRARKCHKIVFEKCWQIYE